MTKPLPWSFTSLEQFVSCPRSFHEQRVLKTVVPTQGEEAKWGEHVHKVFENYHRQRGTTLPSDLHEHKAFMDEQAAWQGTAALEEKIALNIKQQPCGFFDPDVWFRGVIDYRKNIAKTARLVDYKTGKPKSSTRQLMLFALWTFAKFPDIDTIIAYYYWTKTCTKTIKTWDRRMIPEMWADVVPDLRQYKEAFQTDTWQPRQSGLCRGWCPVQDCEYWNPRRT